jgi:hypothetical protein
VYFGNVDYDSADLGWAYCFPAMMLFDRPAPAFTAGNPIPIADNITIALLGAGAAGTPRPKASRRPSGPIPHTDLAA